MKICYVNPTFLIRRPIAELIGRLSKDKKNKISIFVPKKPFKKLEGKWHSDSALSKAKVYSYSAINIPFSNFEWPIPITPMFFINLFRIFRKYNIIHMWTYFYINSWFSLIFKLFSKKIILIMTTDTFPAYSFSSGKIIDFSFFVYTKLFGWFLFSVPDKIQIYGTSILKAVEKIGIKKNKLVILPTGTNIKFEKGKNIRKELGFKDKDFILVYAGLIVPRKGIDTILKTVKKLNEKNIKLLVVGEGPKKAEYVKMADKLGINANFLGWRKDIPSILISSDALFLPSRGEGLPGIVMESMAAGLPVVASDIPCTKDLVKNGKSGFLCPIEDINSYAEKILKLMKNKKERKIIGYAAKERIQKFQWDKLLKRYFKMYSE